MVQEHIYLTKRQKKSFMLSDSDRLERRRATHARYRLRHAEKLKQRQKRWHCENREGSRAITRRAYAKSHPESLITGGRLWHKQNPDLAKVRSNEKKKALYKQWRANNPERVKELRHIWKQHNRAKLVAKEAERRAMKLQATPRWVDHCALVTIYELAAQKKMTVDHIVPLKNHLVCGLHVPWNLQLLSHAENSRKHNKFDERLAISLPY